MKWTAVCFFYEQPAAASATWACARREPHGRLQKPPEQLSQREPRIPLDSSRRRPPELRPAAAQPPRCSAPFARAPPRRNPTGSQEPARDHPLHVPPVRCAPAVQQEQRGGKARPGAWAAGALRCAPPGAHPLIPLIPVIPFTHQEAEDEAGGCGGHGARGYAGRGEPPPSVLPRRARERARSGGGGGGAAPRERGSAVPSRLPQEPAGAEGGTARGSGDFNYCPFFFSPFG